MSQASGGYGAAAEVAPSESRAPDLTVMRLVGGFGGLFLFTLGVASVIAAAYNRGILGVEWGYLCTAVGLGLLLLHAIRDTDTEIRRVYGGAAALLLLIAVGVGIFPAKPDAASEPVAGYYLLPWGALLGFVSLVFLLTFARNETADPYRAWAHTGLLGTGGLLCVGGVLVGLANPEGMAGPGIVLGLLGVAFLCGYFSVSDTSEGLPYTVALGLGVLGAAVAVYAVGRSVLPTVLFEGPAALKKPNMTYDQWKVGGRGLLVLASLSGLLALRSKTLPNLLKYAAAAIGVAFAGALLVGSFTKTGTQPGAFLVPGGLLLFAVGFAFLLVSVAVTVDHPLVVLTRRELASLFYSPIFYIVLFGAAVVAGFGHMLFLRFLYTARSVPEPIVANHDGLMIFSQIAVLFVVPALTMRAFSEEKRSGTLEVLLTAPVGEWTVVLSKFFPVLLTFLLTWVPSALYLLALRSVGGNPFDYRPLLSYYAAVAVSGCGFVGMGLFFSSVTRNQIVAAVLTFAGMFSLLMASVLAGHIGGTFRDWSPETAGGLAELVRRFGYLEFWNTALSGQLEVPAVVLSVSVAAVWLFLTVKVLEARKWG